MPCSRCPRSPGRTGGGSLGVWWPHWCSPCHALSPPPPPPRCGLAPHLARVPAAPHAPCLPSRRLVPQSQQPLAAPQGAASARGRQPQPPAAARQRPWPHPAAAAAAAPAAAPTGVAASGVAGARECVQRGCRRWPWAAAARCSAEPLCAPPCVWMLPRRTHTTVNRPRAPHAPPHANPHRRMCTTTSRTRTAPAAAHCQSTGAASARRQRQQQHAAAAAAAAPPRAR
jgi:hypothetical protein